MLTITLVSLVVAGFSGLIAWRSIRRESLRSTARVASLAAAIDDAASARGGADPPILEYSLDFRSSGFFDFPTEDASIAAHWSVRRRLMTVALGGATVAAVVVGIAMTADRYDPPTQPLVSPHAESLELLSLDAAREGSTLAVTGRVRSRADEPLTMVTAVVSAIDAKGRPVGRGSVPLAAILPRRESRFVVTIAEVSEAARYRVSFRSVTGVIRHVDRRVVRASDVS